MATATTTKKKASGKRARPEGPSPEEKLTAELVAMLEAGINPWRKEWKGCGGSQRYRNLITGHAYRGCNPAVLSFYCGMRGYALPLFVGIAQAKAKGWWPVKGSKGCYILRPQLNKRTETDKDGNVVKGPDGQPLVAAWVSYKAACVFNVADLKGQDDETQASLQQAISDAMGQQDATPEPERLAAAEAVLGAWPVPVAWGGDRACYFPAADRINMPERKAFLSAGALYATWAHEISHSTGHKSRLGRDLSGTFGSDSYAREELVAELSAFLIGNRLEIGSDASNHAAYLGSWATVLKESPKVLFKVLSDATKAANLVCGPEVIEAGE